ncbi:MAG: ABC transporter permease, partial [Acidobacteria bacterium]|nr:ABC transporter permease [Acidobacteriota bacterium]
KLSQVSLGFQPENVVSVQVRPNFTNVASTEAYLRNMRGVLARAQAIPEVAAAALTARTPLAAGLALNRGLVFEGQAVDPNAQLAVVSFSAASPMYFETLKVPISRGRRFRDSDERTGAPPVAVVNATMARRRWPNQDPIGRRFQIPGRNAQWITVVGVCGDVRSFSIDQEAGEQVYFPTSVLTSASHLLVQTSGDPRTVIGRLREAVYAVDPEQAIAEVRTMPEILSDQLSAPQLTLKLTGLLALLTLLITVAGIGGVAAASAGSRKTEIGIRMALGAAPKGLIGMIVRRELVMVAAGLAAGVAAGLAFTRMLGNLLYETPPHDPLSLSAAAVLMLGAAAVACLLPAMRAVRVDPLETLRSE